MSIIICAQLLHHCIEFYTILIGEKGDEGYVGLTGIDGPQGQKGDIGFPGRRGETGDFGLQGEIGLDGRPGK